MPRTVIARPLLIEPLLWWKVADDCGSGGGTPAGKGKGLT